MGKLVVHDTEGKVGEISIRNKELVLPEALEWVRYLTVIDPGTGRRVSPVMGERYLRALEAEFRTPYLMAKYTR